MASITVNDKEVSILKNENGHDRGLYIAIINPQTGAVAGMVFDTYESSTKFDNFIKNYKTE